MDCPMAIASWLGVEAARGAIKGELLGSLEGGGVDLGEAHADLIADVMVWSGRVQGLNYKGFREGGFGENSLFSQASWRVRVFLGLRDSSFISSVFGDKLGNKWWEEGFLQFL